MTRIEGEELRGAKRDRHAHMQEVEAAHAQGFRVRGSKAFCLLEGLEGLPLLMPTARSDRSPTIPVPPSAESRP